MSTFNKTEYDKQYKQTNIKRIAFDVSKEEYETFSEYCTKINMQKVTYLKMLIDNDAISRGYTAIFGKDKRFRKEND